MKIVIIILMTLSAQAQDLFTCRSHANSISAPRLRNQALTRCFNAYKERMTHTECLFMASDYIGNSYRNYAIRQCSQIEKSQEECMRAARAYDSATLENNEIRKCFEKYAPIDEESQVDGQNGETDTFNPDDIDLGQ